MKFTLLPDMEAKKENRKKRKILKREKMLAKSDRRRRRALSRRDSFWKIFTKRFIALMIVGVIICAAGTIMAERKNYLRVKKVYESWKSNIYHDAVLATYELDLYGDMYTDEEKQAMFAARVRAKMLLNNHSNMYDFSATMYEEDWDEGIVNKVCDSQEGIVLGVDIFRDVSSRETLFYECPIEVFGDIDFVKHKGEFSENGSGQSLSINDCYIKGTEFRPGVVTISHVREDGSVTKRERYDLTPENTEGWLHIDSEEEREKRFAAAEGKEGTYPHYFMVQYIGGTKKDSPAYADTNTIEYETYDDGSLMSINYFANENEIERSDLESNVFEDEVYGAGMVIPNIKWKSMDKEYGILTYGYYDFYEYHMNDCIRAYCIAVLLVIVLALLMARNRWLRVKTEYEIEDYRKSLTDAMAHDLKSPLMALSGFAENLKDNVHTEKRGYYADVISENVNYMNSIIERILELSKTEGDIKLKRERVEVQTLLNEAVSKYEEQIDKKKLTVDIEGDITINADRQLLLQAIDNLIFNAVKFSNDESIIYMACDKNCMTISNTCTAGEDEPDELDFLKPFVKGDKSRSNKSGSGIGLTIAKNIFELHGYKISLKREENEFIVRVCF